jgi:hypothetical protein
MVTVMGVERRYRASPVQQESPDGSLDEAMISYGNIDKKGADEPDPADLYPGGEFELRNDSSASDGLNGSIQLDDGVLSAVGADKGDPVRVYAEANGRWILYERDTYSDRAGVGMPKSHREKLKLHEDNRAVQLWLDEADKSTDESETEETAGTAESSTNRESNQQEYVLIPENSPVTYHHVSSSNDYGTECGLSFGEKEYRKFTDPGNALDQCSDCAVRSSNDMTNKELVKWIGEQAGFEADDGTPAYLSKDQLVAIRDYILDLQEDQENESKVDAASLNLTEYSAKGQS